MSDSKPPSLLSVHTPSSSFALIHSLTQESILSLYDKLSRKAHTDYHGQRVGPGWLKYEYNNAIWDLDDESDYTIFTWRQRQLAPDTAVGAEHIASTSALPPPPQIQGPAPTLHLHNPAHPLPVPPAYLNPSYYLFQPSRAHLPPSRSPAPSRSSKRSKRSKKNNSNETTEDGVPQFKKAFEKFHSENGVRTVLGSIGPVNNVRMLLKAGYRHVYISRKFAQKHGFIPNDATPGHYGYSGLVNIGTWPITLTRSLSTSFGSSHEHLQAPPTPSRSPSPRRNPVSGRLKSKPNQGGLGSDLANGNVNGSGAKPTFIQVYLSEEPHFDVVLGRSFFEKRQIKTSAVDPTDVVCLDTGEKIECELVILKDGRGEIVTIT